MNILLVSSLFPPNVVGGAELSVEALATGLAARGHNITVLTAAQRWGQGVSDLRISEGLNVHFRHTSHWGSRIGKSSRTEAMKLHVADLFGLSGKNAIRQELNNRYYDIVHTNTLVGFSTQIWRLAAEANIPVVHTLRDYYLLCVRGTMRKAGATCERQCTECRLVSEFRTRHFRHVGAIVGISRYILNAHEQAGVLSPSATRDVIANAVIPTGSSAPRRVRNKGEGTVFGYLGRLHHSKGIETLLAAFSSVPGLSRLRIGGAGNFPYVSKLKTLAHDSRIEFPGFVRPDDFLASIDILVVPSEWPEPLGRVILEAYLYGVPVIASACGGIPEVVADGVTGWLYPPGDRIALAKLIRRAIESQQPDEATIRACEEKATLFTPDQCAKSYEMVYSKLCAEGNEAISSG